MRTTLDSWVSHSQTAGLQRITAEAATPTDEEQRRIEVIEGEIETLVDLLEDEASDASEQEAAETRVRELNDAIEAIVNKLPILDASLQQRAGAFLILDEEGRPRLSPGLYLEADNDPLEQGEGDAARGLEAKANKAPGLSQRLLDELAIQRRDILAVHIAADAGLALDLAIFLMNDREAGHSSERSGFSLTAPAAPNPVFGFETPGASATIARTSASDTLQRSWTSGKTRAERFEAFRSLSEEMRGAWLGHAVSRTLEASINQPGERHCAFHDHLGQLVGISVADWWRPTGANFFDRVPKSSALAALREVGGDAFAARYANAKKPELAQSCERIFFGDFIGEVEVKEAASAWLPDVMRFASEACSQSVSGTEADPAVAPLIAGDDLGRATALEVEEAA